MTHSINHFLKGVVVLGWLGLMVLYSMSCDGVGSLHDASRAGDIAAVKHHIAEGVDVNAKDQNGLNPLHLAANGGHTEVATLLIAKGADVHAKDRYNGRTSLHWAVRFGHTEMATLLLAKGADVNAKDREGRTPLQHAEENGKAETVKVLKKHGAQ